MTKNKVQIGHVYAAKISGDVVPVRLVGESPYGGWEGTNLRTSRNVRIKSAAKLRRELIVGSELYRFYMGEDCRLTRYLTRVKQTVGLVDLYRVRFTNGRAVVITVPFDSAIPETHAKAKAVEVMRARCERAGEPIEAVFIRRADRRIIP